MFAVETTTENGFDIVWLRDTGSGAAAGILPSCGGILHAFNIPDGNGWLNIVEQYNSKSAFETGVEAGGFKSCKLSPFACRLRNGRFHFAEQDYQVEKFYLGKHALHGLIYDAPFDVVHSAANEDSARVELLFSYKGTDKGYPFKYDCRLMYELKPGQSLTLTTFIKNLESTAIPVSDGWHPYFSFGKPVDELLLSFQSKEMLEFDAELIPTKRLLPYEDFTSIKRISDTAFDHCFTLKSNKTGPVVALKDAERRLQLEIEPDKSYPFLQLYIPDHRRSIAIENLSAAPDAFNNCMGLTHLRGGGEAVYSTCYRVRKV